MKYNKILIKLCENYKAKYSKNEFSVNVFICF